MKMGVLGSGMLGQAISARLAELGHNVWCIEQRYVQHQNYEMKILEDILWRTNLSAILFVSISV